MKKFTFKCEITIDNCIQQIDPFKAELVNALNQVANMDHVINITLSDMIPVEVRVERLVPVIECRLFQMQGGIGLKRKDGTQLDWNNGNPFTVRIVD